MTFQFTAAGSRAETLASVKSQIIDDEVGGRVRDLLVAILEDGVDKGAGKPLRYSLNVFGHASPGSIPSLLVEMSAHYAPDYGPAGDPATTAAPPS
jgi:hypothetical protein